MEMEKNVPILFCIEITFCGSGTEQPSEQNHPLSLSWPASVAGHSTAGTMST